VIYVLLTGAAVLPAFLLVWFFHARDTFPEPARVLWTTFGLGCASVVPAVLLGVTVEPVLLSTDALSVAAFEAFVIAALCEETAKLAVLLGYSFRHGAFDESMDGIVYGATASLGFAAVENVLYVLDGGFGLAVVRGLLSVPGHATYGAVMGYYVGRARFDPANRWRLVGLGLLAAILLHGLYDFPLMLIGDQASAGPSPVAGAVPDASQPSGDALLLLLAVWVGTVVGGWTWSLRLVRRVRAEQATKVPLPAPPPGAVPTLVTGTPAGAAQARPGAAVEAREVVPAAVVTWQRVAAWAAVIGGGALASAAFLFTALAIVFSATGDVPREDWFHLAVGVFIVGVLPGTAAIALFVLGVRRLNRVGA
jgi:hypothetical protein